MTERNVDGAIKIGDYEVYSDTEGGFWITHANGEGGDFTNNSRKFYELVKKFYEEHF